MASSLKFRIVAVVAIFTTLLGIYSARLWDPKEVASNFEMYYTAACLVRSHMSPEIYDVIDPNSNPQDVFASPNSVWAQTARAHGISRITLYLYPPTLADLLVPLSFFSAPTAQAIWNILNILMIVGMSFSLCRALEINFPGATALVSSCILLFRPTMNNLHWGQVSIVLAFLVTVGFGFYVRDRKVIAALLFALAIAIKLEPIVLIVPLIAWRDWKCLRNMVVWGVLICLGIWAVNGTYALNLYFFHQLPAMSAGNLGTSRFDGNRSIGNFFYSYLSGAVSAHALAWLVRIVSALILCVAGWFSLLKHGERLTRSQQFEIGIVFLLFACALAPYSWFYNWAVSAPAFVMLCKRAWDNRAGTSETVLLIAFLLALCTAKFHMAMLTPIIGAALALTAMYKMSLERRNMVDEQISQIAQVSLS